VPTGKRVKIPRPDSTKMMRMKKGLNAFGGSPKDVPWCSGVHEKMERKTFYTGKLDRAA
jgi:hypothetical protein